MPVGKILPPPPPATGIDREAVRHSSPLIPVMEVDVAAFSKALGYLQGGTHETKPKWLSIELTLILGLDFFHTCRDSRRTKGFVIIHSGKVADFGANIVGSEVHLLDLALEREKNIVDGSHEAHDVTLACSIPSLQGVRGEERLTSRRSPVAQQQGLEVVGRTIVLLIDGGGGGLEDFGAALKE